MTTTQYEATGLEVTRPTPVSSRVLLVHGHRTFAELLALALEREDDLTVVGHARTVAEARRHTGALAPDLVLVDVHLSDGSGLDATAELTAQHPDLRVVVLTGDNDLRVVQRAAAAGACGLLPDDVGYAGILQALRSARRGSLVLHPEVLSVLSDDAPAVRVADAPRMTARELEVLDLLAQGLNARAIARRTGLSVADARAELARVMAGLGARSHLEAVVTANRYGLISVGPG